MDIYDYLLDTDSCAWDKLLLPYAERLPQNHKVWLANQFGDLFLIAEDETIHLLNATTGAIGQIAENKESFFTALAENLDELLYVHLINQARERGLTLEAGQCYSFKVPLILSGELAVTNIQISDLATVYAFIADLAAQVKGLPEGMPVNLSLSDPE
mgnify:CR=1 FL=1